MSQPQSAFWLADVPSGLPASAPLELPPQPTATKARLRAHHETQTAETPFKSSARPPASHRSTFIAASDSGNKTANAVPR
jgi:hypothetical protein